MPPFRIEWKKDLGGKRMTEAAMQLINVSKRIGKKEIIKDLSFTINKGEVFGLIGQNGAGKTTTIRMMVGLMKLSEEDVHILGKRIKINFIETKRELRSKGYNHKH